MRWKLFKDTHILQKIDEVFVSKKRAEEVMSRLEYKVQHLD